jgi:hypothetical protein
MILFAPSLSGAPWSLICLIASLILLFVAAFIGPPVTDGPFYRRLNFGWAGLFFYVLAVAVA